MAELAREALWFLALSRWKSGEVGPRSPVRCCLVNAIALTIVR
jgi:hypothetical protein